MSFVVVAYFTENYPYPEHAKNLIDSLKQFNLIYEISPIENLGDWYKNIQYKPTFLREKLQKFYPHPIVYVDIDAVFLQKPILFDQLEQTSHVDIAVHILDHSKRRRQNQPPELLSGTIFLRNSVVTQTIVDCWIKECKGNTKLWDQKALAKVLEDRDYYRLPEEYCCIFDYMNDVKNPVIQHFQASRQSRNKMQNTVSKGWIKMDSRGRIIK